MMPSPGQNDLTAGSKYSGRKDSYHWWNYCRPWLQWRRVYMGMFCNILLQSMWK